jgi:hypothetical protein
MIEQRDNQLLLTFPSPAAARAFAQFLQTVLPVSPASPAEAAEASATYSPVSESGQQQGQLHPPSPFLPPRHVILTEERQAALSLQRELGQTSRQRQLRAQTTLRDGVLPFRKLEGTPPPSGQVSPRLRAQQEGGFADGSGPEPRIQPSLPQQFVQPLALKSVSKLRPVRPSQPRN